MISLAGSTCTRAVPKYRYMVVHEGVLEADDERDAENVAFWKAENGLAASTVVQVEQVRENGEQT